MLDLQGHFLVSKHNLVMTYLDVDFLGQENHIRTQNVIWSPDLNFLTKQTYI
jgi:hypothetical protein